VWDCHIIKKYALPLTWAFALMFCLVFQLNENAPKPSKGSKKSLVEAKGTDFSPYITEVERRIRHNWSPSSADYGKLVILHLNIAQNGKLKSLTLLENSGSTSAATAAIRAVKLSSPFNALPAKYPGHTVPLDLIFDYQVYCYGKKSHTDTFRCASASKELNEADAKSQLDSYMIRLEKDIRRNWSPSDRDRDKRVVVILYIAENGLLEAIKVVGDSGSRSADAAALDAIKLSAPFEKPPCGYYGNTGRPLEFTFDKQLINGGPSGRQL